MPYSTLCVLLLVVIVIMLNVDVSKLEADHEINRNDEEAADADLDYPVIAYYCDEGNEELATAPTYNQGDVLQVCIRMDDELDGEDIFVEDIVSFTLSQLGDPALAATPTIAIQNRQTDPLTLKDCGAGDGRCNVKHQLTSKFFDDPSPGDLEVNGIALIGFGTPTGGRKLLRVPVRGLLRAPQEHDARELQESGPESEFDLSFQLNPAILPATCTEADESNNDQGSNNTIIIVIVAVVVVFVSVALAVIACVFLYYYRHSNKDRGEAQQQTRRSVGGGAGKSLQSSSSGRSTASRVTVEAENSS